MNAPLASSARDRGADAAQPRALWALSFGNFAIGTGVLVVAGMLGELARGVHVSVPVAGQLMAAGAAVVCFGAPVFAALTSRIDRRALLVVSMAWYAVGLGAAALVDDYATLLAIRVLSLVSAAIFTPQAAATITVLVPPEHRGRAIAGTFLGWSIASVVAMPMAAWGADRFGWRVVFATAAGFAVIAALGVASAIPRALHTQPLPWSAWRAVGTRAALVAVLAITALQSWGQFTLFTYLAPALQALVPGGAGLRAGLMALLGVAGVVGNAWLARRVDRIGPARGAAIALACIGTGMASWPLAQGSGGIAAIVFVVWGLGLFATNSAQQARLASIAPALAGASIALNTSSIYIGQALGSITGGALIAHVGIASLSWVGAALVFVALALSQTIVRPRTPT